MIKIDKELIEKQLVSYQDEDGEEVNLVGINVSLLVEESYASALLELFNEEDPASPNDTISRDIARMVLVALKNFNNL